MPPARIGSPWPSVLRLDSPEYPRLLERKPEQLKLDQVYLFGRAADTQRLQRPQPAQVLQPGRVYRPAGSALLQVIERLERLAVQNFTYRHRPESVDLPQAHANRAARLVDPKPGSREVDVGNREIVTLPACGCEVLRALRVVIEQGSEPFRRVMALEVGQLARQDAVGGRVSAIEAVAGKLLHPGPEIVTVELGGFRRLHERRLNFSECFLR